MTVSDIKTGDISRIGDDIQYLISVPNKTPSDVLDGVLSYIQAVQPFFGVAREK
jgi:hypothetical protein